MKKVLILLFLVICFLGFGCVSTSQSQEIALKNTIPKWISDQGRLELFPASSFISQIGYGSTAQESKEKAAAAISEYIKASVSASTASNYFYKESDNYFTENIELKDTIQIHTNNDLYKIEYTNPYYYKDLGQYVCVAFINKEQAFNFVKPKLEIARIQFSKNYYKALEEISLLDKIRGIKNAQLVLKDFYEVYDFARAIMSEKAKVYEEIDFLANESIMKLKELSGTIIRIEGIGNIQLLEQSGVITELSNQFSRHGYIIGDMLEIGCLVQVEIKAIITETKETFETYPEIYIKIFEDGEIKISYAKKLSKIAGFDKETVIRRTNTALINEVKTSFVDECF